MYKVNSSALEDFSIIIDDLIALYYDAVRGFESNYYFMKTKTMDQPADTLIYPERPEHIDDSEAWTVYDNKGNYQCTIKDYEERNRYNGKNHSDIGNLIVCQLFAY